MIKKHLKTLIITSILTLLPILAGIYLWNTLPEQVPSHWDVNGEIDGWSSKPFFVFGLPCIMLAAQWLCVLGTAADPKKANHSGKVMQLVLWIIPVLSIILSAMTYMVVLGHTVRVEVIMPLIIGLVFTIIGNYLPKCKQSYTVGIKIPWTLHSEGNWNRTHRFAGRLWLVCGLGIMLTAFIGGFWVFLPIVLVMVLAPMVYSYVLHRKGI
jgi:uncharacterized membrane protein